MLSASEVAEFSGYCEQSWWLRRAGVHGATAATVWKENGRTLHVNIGRSSDALVRMDRARRALRLTAVLLALLAAVLALVGVISGTSPVFADEYGGNGDHRNQAVSSASGLVLVATIVACGLATLVAGIASVRAEGLRKRLGVGALGQDGHLIAADDSLLGAVTLRAEGWLGLVARPDQLVRIGDGAIVPVEQKPRASLLFRSHVVELAVQLMLVEEQFGRRPPFGLVVLAGGVAKRIAYEPSLKVAVIDAAERMRRHLATGEAPGRRWLGNKCRACEFFDHCWATATTTTAR